MSKRLLELNFAQLSKNWSKSKNNRYSDKLKDDYHGRLDNLFEKMSAEDFNNLTELDIQERTKVINFFFYSINFLDNSTISNIPFEIVKCLETVLNDWSDDNYIIVTSLVKEQNGFSFDNRLSFGFDYTIIENLYGIRFTHKLIQINVPEFLAHDYLANSVLYHELGHFIDHKFNISEILTYQLLNELVNDKADMKQFEVYFPLHHQEFVKDNRIAKQGQFQISLKSHFAEYFCDLFAAQYVADSIANYLRLITNNQINVNTPSHPSTVLRNQMVDDFLNNNQNFYIDIIRDAIDKTTNKELKIRYEEFITEDFINLIPVNIENDEQLHYLFKHGWNLWLDNWAAFEKANDMKYDLQSFEIYNIVNGLIEKSIGNYIVSKFWKKIDVSK